MAPKGGLIDDRVSLKQCKKAVQALHTHETKKQEQLLETELLPGKEPNIWLNVAVKQMPLGAKLKPAKMSVCRISNFSSTDTEDQSVAP